MHIHLDAVGGVAGDMFVAAIVDARSDLKSLVDTTVAALQLPAVEANILAHDDGRLVGRRFRVSCPDPPHSTVVREVRESLMVADLSATVRERALAILALLAEAEAEVHGIVADEVKFHELGGLDTIVDLSVSAALIEALGVQSWSCGALPRGRGMVRIAHGTFPVPAPATLILLRDMTLVDDGVDGERITPTGAAILKHLAPSQAASDPTPRRLLAVGNGFGTATLEGRSNILRAQLYESVTRRDADQVAVIAFDVDDQSPEDLALALDRLRALDAVLDVTQSDFIGKGGRLAARIQVLAPPETREAVAAACFSETATIGLRWTIQNRVLLSRRETVMDGEGGSFRAKIVARPDGKQTAKAEMADLADVGDRAQRERLRRQIEQWAVEMRGESDDDA
jgi:hypothetical protein